MLSINQYILSNQSITCSSPIHMSLFDYYQTKTYIINQLTTYCIPIHFSLFFTTIRHSHILSINKLPVWLIHLSSDTVTYYQSTTYCMPIHFSLFLLLSDTVTYCQSINYLFPIQSMTQQFFPLSEAVTQQATVNAKEWTKLITVKCVCIQKKLSRKGHKYKAQPSSGTKRRDEEQWKHNGTVAQTDRTKTEPQQRNHLRKVSRNNYMWLKQILLDWNLVLHSDAAQNYKNCVQALYVCVCHFDRILHKLMICWLSKCLNNNVSFFELHRDKSSVVLRYRK